MKHPSKGSLAICLQEVMECLIFELESGGLGMLRHVGSFGDIVHDGNRYRGALVKGVGLPQHSIFIGEARPPVIVWFLSIKGGRSTSATGTSVTTSLS